MASSPLCQAHWQGKPTIQTDVGGQELGAATLPANKGTPLSW